MYKIFNNQSYNYNLNNDFNKVANDIMGEFSAIIQYGEHADETNNMITKNTWDSIKHEEMVHIGELLSLLYKIDPMFKTQVEKGMTEFQEKNN